MQIELPTYGLPIVMDTVDSKCLCLIIYILWNVSKDFVRRYKNPKVELYCYNDKT